MIGPLNVLAAGLPFVADAAAAGAALAVEVVAVEARVATPDCNCDAHDGLNAER